MHKMKKAVGIALIFLHLLVALVIFMAVGYNNSKELEAKGKALANKYNFQEDAVYCVNGDPYFRVIYRDWWYNLSEVKVTTLGGENIYLKPDRIKECDD